MSFPAISYSPQPRRTGSVSSNSNLTTTNNPTAPPPPPAAPAAPAGPRASGSSSHSTRSSTTTNPVNPFNSSHMESTVTRLLVATKQLLESLTDWSQGKIDEGGVSDIYVRLGNEFNAASLAFTKEGINMSDLNSVPDDLRACLEAALSEEASPITLDQHLPQIRQIVVHLLQGLKVKQAKWRAAKRQHDHEASSSYTNRPGSVREHGIPPDRPPLPHPSIRSGPRSLHATRSREDLRRAAVVSTSSHSDHHRSQPLRATSPGPSHSRSIGPSDHPNILKSSDPLPGTRSSYDNPSSGPSVPSKSRMSPVSRAVRSVNDFSERLRGNKVSPPPPAPPPPPPIPPQFDPSRSQSRRHDNIPIPPTPRSPRSESSNQAQASSLEALRKADMLQRRASKRFSTYTYNKIAATASPHKRTGESQNNLVPNVPALPRSPNSMNFLLPRDDIESARETSQAGRELLRASSSQRSQDGQSANDNAGSGSRPGSRATEVDDSFDQARDHISTIAEETQQSIRINPITPESTNKFSNFISTSPRHKNHVGSSANLSEHPCTIFLQLGRDVKKAKLDSTPTIGSLRVLFMDRFQFNPGSDNFPEIYLRDPQSGVQYQLEDMSEVKDRVVLSLNIDALDQVKTHIDSRLSTLAREIKDLKSTITTLRRQSIPPPPLSSATPIKSATESQFKQTARQVMKSSETTAESGTQKTEQPVESGSPRPPDSASSSSDLRLQQLNGTFKNQYGEVQALRRDLGILRQLYGTFTGETKSLLAGLRSQAEAVKQAATAKVASSRTFIDAGKVKLETQSQDLVTKVESLQDTVEDLKQDVTNRKMKPKPSAMVTVSQSIQTVKAELEQLTNHITTIKPAWKKSWEDELQNIVDEQQLLNYQEDLIKDLKEDLEAVSNLFGHVEHYLDARKVSKVRPKEFIPILSPTTSTGGLPSDPRGGLETVLMQVKGLEPNQESRLKAIEAAEKLRAKNLEEVQKENEFAQELAGFVGNKKLKMTGGHEEIERMRKIKSEAALKSIATSKTSADHNNNKDTTSPLEIISESRPAESLPNPEPSTDPGPPPPTNDELSPVDTPTDEHLEKTEKDEEDQKAEDEPDQPIVDPPSSAENKDLNDEEEGGGGTNELESNLDGGHDDVADKLDAGEPDQSVPQNTGLPRELDADDKTHIADEPS
ncbi:Bud site selection protein 6 [Puccinia graminis f. sp. tritici]|uniref:Bud site selection protein 6 n=1 Tax=Puccinia graminis f. sp. tritici TaxID=56615 RepID=A0A5B0PWE5_PUCGR|nr:Bud site selection protein 6 [Puccinia graminis f. sp. tritici]KAA1104909.1 Bud site selection protein 6 [Puccinia graminis f. sp. tritici]